MKRPLSVLAALVAGLLSLLLPLTPAAAYGTGTVFPAHHLRVFADPEIIKVGDTYYAYASNNQHRVPVSYSKNLASGWANATEAMPTKAAWASDAWTWAPEVLRVSDTDYRMYFTARHTASGKQCIGIATARHPMGPFVPAPAPFVCNPGEGGDIDASTFRDTDGALYLLYKSDTNSLRPARASSIYLQRLSADGRSLVGSRRALISATLPAEQLVVEAPVMVKRGGRYVLFYSGGVFSGPGYHTSYATSTSLGGTFTKPYRPLMTTASLDNTVQGPGGADVITDQNGDHLLFHGHVGNDQRDAYLADLGFVNGYPVVRGSRVRIEAESGVVSNAKVVTGGAYSQGKAVGYLDTAASSLRLSVYAPRTGSYTVHVAYDAGYGDATHHVTVNGAPAGDIAYAGTGGWGVVREADINVELVAGTNTITFTHGERWAQIDHIEVA